MKRILWLVLSLLLTTAWPAPAAQDPFYLSLLREGIEDYDRGDFAAAARTLRIACFGMLDEPPALAGCLARLALAQDRANDADGFQETFRRIVESEERFQAYTKADLPKEVRASLEQRLVARVSVATLRSIPAFKALADRQAQTPRSGREPKKGRKDAQELTTAPPPSTAPRKDTALATNGADGNNGSPPSSAAQKPAPAPIPTEITAQERESMTQARRLLDQNSKIKELRQAFDLARQVADAHIQSVEAQHLAAEAAYRISRWEDAARYFRRGGEPAADKPELQFYMAVALFESGDAQTAAAILKRSLPNLQRTAYVDAYARKILG